MSNFMKSQSRPRLIFFGMSGYYSSAVFTALLQSKVEIGAVVMPASTTSSGTQRAMQRREPPQTHHAMLLLTPRDAAPSIAQLAWQRRIPLWEVHHLRDPETVATLASYQADLWCVACFSMRFPGPLLALPRLGCLNVHPSLLPANRGPVPLFWTLREGHTVTGVTIHFLEERMDAGDILAQQRVAVPDGITYDELDALCARTGGVLLAQTVQALCENRAIRRPQDEAQSSYYSYPEEQDFVVKASEWDARHVYNFVRGISSWDIPVNLVGTDSSHIVYDALDFGFDAIPVTEENTSTSVICCRKGWVRVSV
jgi:methionyl-tRNA formyltransferase